MHRDTDGVTVVGHCTGDRLAHPPGGVGRELVAAAIFEFVDGLHQSQIAFLNQIGHCQTAVDVTLGNRDHQTKVGFDHLGLGVGQISLSQAHLTGQIALIGNR